MAKEIKKPLSKAAQKIQDRARREAVKCFGPKAHEMSPEELEAHVMERFGLKKKEPNVPET